MTPARPGGRVVVVGGGVAGLASAALLARAGYDVDLVEKNAEPGGRAGTWSQDGFRFDTGPSWYLMPQVFEHFYELLGTTASEQLDLVRLDPAYRVFFEDHLDPLEPVDLPAGAEAAAALFERLEPGAGAQLHRYLASAAQVYDLAVGRFLYTTYQSFGPLVRPDVVRRAVRLLALLTTPLDRFVGKRFQDNRIRQILGYPAVFLGTSPDRAPSLYHLMSHVDLTDGVLYPQGGLTMVVDSLVRLCEQEGVRLHLGTSATQILTADLPAKRTGGRAGEGGRGTRLRRRPLARAVGVRVVGADGTERDLAADVVVGAADLHHVETALLPPELRTYPQKWWDRRESGPGAVLVYLGVRGRLPQLEHHSLFFTTDWADNFDAVFGARPRVPDPASIYVCRPSATDPSVAPADDENLFVLVPVPADVSLGGGGTAGAGSPQVEQVADAAIAQIARWAGIPDLAERVVLRRTVGPADFAREINAWKGGALGLGHTARQSAFFRGRNVSRTVAGLHYAGHNTIPGIGLPMCLISAEILLKSLHGDTSTTPLPIPLSPPPPQPTPSSEGLPAPTPGRREVVDLGLPGPSARGMLRAFTAIRADPLRFLAETRTTYGDLVAFPVPGSPVLLVSDPDDVRRVLQTGSRTWGKDTIQYAALARVTGPGLLASADSGWIGRRRLAAPAFHHDRMASLSGEVTLAARQAVGRLGTLPPAGTTVDVAQLSMEVALDVVGRTLFSADLSPQATELLDASSRAAGLIVAVGASVLPLPAWLPTPTRLRLRSATGRLDRLCRELLVQRRHRHPSGSHGDDLLGLLLDAGLTDDEVRDELVTMVVAGHETMAGGMAWTFMLLAEHPAVQARVRAEIADQRRSGRPLTLYDAAQQLPLARAAIDEALRLYPPAWVVSRRSTEPDVLGGRPVPAGTTAVVSPWVIHRRAESFERPLEFDPDRFLDPDAGGARTTPRPDYLPFGLGPRLCIGRDLALGEMTLLLRELLSGHELALPVRSDGAGWTRPAAQARVAVHPSGGMPLVVRPASESSRERTGAPTDGETDTDRRRDVVPSSWAL